MITTLLTTLLLVILCVIIHCESLKRVHHLIARLPHRPRLNVGLGVVGALLAHLIEIGVFAVGLNVMIGGGRFGRLTGIDQVESDDVMHFSMVAYTSVGYGDIIPVGPLRFMAGMETLTGLVLIAWTASFMFLEMSNYWEEQDAGGNARS